MVEHGQSFWQSAAGSGVTMFASIGLAMLLVSALAGADVVTALSDMMRQAFSVSQTFSDMVLTMMMQLGAITSTSGGAVDIATLDAAARGQLIEQLVLIMDTLMRLEILMQMATAPWRRACWGRPRCARACSPAGIRWIIRRCAHGPCRKAGARAGCDAGGAVCADADCAKLYEQHVLRLYRRI